MTVSRDKYIAALEEQERLEKQLAAQAELMRKTLIHLSSASQGLDENLDKELLLLKDKMRGASGMQVVEQMERVHQAVSQFERHRDQENTDAIGKFSLLVQQLLELNISPEVRKNLNVYKADLKSRLNSWRIYPQLISELAAVQALALKAASEPPQSFFQRLKGGGRLKAPEQTREQNTEEKKPISSEDDEAVHAEPSNIDARTPTFDTPESEDGYEQVAKRISQTLKSLVESIDSNDLIKHKVDIVHSRLDRGMDWFALAVTLEDIRDILMQRYLAADKEFSDYLLKVNEDLNSIREKLGLAVEGDHRQKNAVNTLSSAVSQHVDKMRSSISNSGNLNELKTEVKVHLDEIYQALETYKSSETESMSLAEQLQGLVDRIQSVESDSQKTRVMLEKARYKATHDSLTSLPNREAYGVRVWQEYQRFKRYKRPLSLAVCDIDFFKKINDSYGHQAGDKVLKLFAKMLSDRMREVDFVGRYGGEEFVILMPETSDEQAHGVLDKIRASISKTPFRFRDEPVQITVSFGIAAFRDDDQVENVFARADKALYKAKNQGRNRCILA